MIAAGASAIAHVQGQGHLLSVVHQGLSKAEAARRYQVSWQWVHTLVTRYNEGGLDALEPRSRRPLSNRRATPDPLRERVVELRKQLDADGLDAGPLSIADRLTADGHTAPSTSTIRRILHQAGLIVPAPKKRPRSSLRRFTADQPNECWQSDFTHWQLADGTDIEIIDWLDDHSRLLLSLTAVHRVTGDDVVNTFADNANTYGLPAATLTDNGSVTPPGSPAARTRSNTCSPPCASSRKTATPATPKPKARSNASTKP